MRHIKSEEQHRSEMEQNYCGTTGCKRSLSKHSYSTLCSSRTRAWGAFSLSESAEIAEIIHCVGKHQSKVITWSLHLPCTVRMKGKRKEGVHRASFRHQADVELSPPVLQSSVWPVKSEAPCYCGWWWDMTLSGQLCTYGTMQTYHTRRHTDLYIAFPSGKTPHMFLFKWILPHRFFSPL